MKMKHLLRKLKTGKLERTFSLKREEINEEDRTVPIAFSSEAPVERWFGTEILSHDKKHVRLGRMNDGAPLLVDHDPRDHVGTIEEVSIDSDRRGRAIVRFGRSARAEEIFQDVLDGIRKHISVGYRIHKMEEDRDTGEFRAVDWEPFENSFVSIPADGSVGVLRHETETDNFETDIIYEDRSMKFYDEHGNQVDENGKIIKTRAALDAERAIPVPAPVVATPTPAIDVEAERAATRKDEINRAKEIRALGKEHGQEELAEAAIEDGSTIDQMRSNVLDVLKETKPLPSPEAQLGLSRKETNRFSMLRALNALANPNDKKAQEAAAFEIECSDAVAEKRGIETSGFFVPEQNSNGFVNSRNAGKHTSGIAVPYEVTRADLLAGTATDGAELVADNLLSGSFIDVLRNSSLVAGMGATMLTDLVGDILIPRKTSGSTAAWISAEDGDAANSEPQFDQVSMTPKTAGVYTDISRQLLKQSSIDIENLVRRDIAAGMATLLDLAALYGTGLSGQPTGISATTGINAPTAFAAAVPTYAEVVAMESAVAVDNALMGALGYLLEASMRGSLKTTEKASGTAQFVWEPGNTLNGYGTGVTNQVTSGDLFYGNWADLLIGAWGNLDLLIDPYTNSLKGSVRVVAHQSVDVAVRHPVSFAFNNDTP